MAHSKNMTQKSNYQLNWIIANKPTYSESQIKTAIEELKSREKVNSKVQHIENNLKKLLGGIFRLFKTNS